MAANEEALDDWVSVVQPGIEYRILIGGGQQSYAQQVDADEVTWPARRLVVSQTRAPSVDRSADAAEATSLTVTGTHVSHYRLLDNVMGHENVVGLIERIVYTTCSQQQLYYTLSAMACISYAKH